MGKAYSNDLRRKVLMRHISTGDSLKDLAKRFDVSLGWVKKVSAQYARTGVMDRTPPRRPAGRRKITPDIEEFVRSLLLSKPSVTLTELRAKILELKQIKVSIGTIWHLLKRLGRSKTSGLPSR